MRQLTSVIARAGAVAIAVGEAGVFGNGFAAAPVLFDVVDGGVVDF
jgi:hypothetical protein